MSQDPNVLLVILDSTRAKNLSLYGHANRTTPFLKSFASDRAITYEQARSPGARSVTSHASIFSGLHVEEHGVISAGHKLKPSASIFAKLRQEGYETGVFTENDWLTAVDVGLKDGFDKIVGARNVPFPAGVNPHEFVSNEGRGEYVAFLQRALESEYPLQSLANGVATKFQSDYDRFLPSRFRVSTPADVYVDAFLNWTSDLTGPWAACLNLMDAHIPYEPAEKHNKWGGSRARSLQSSFKDHKWEFNAGDRPWWQKRAVESLYDGAIRQMDNELERLVTVLERRDELDNTLLVVTSDHGEGFGEPSRFRSGIRVAEHGVGIHEVLFHVPLVVHWPGQSESITISEPVSLTNFPDAVSQARRGADGYRAFTSSDPVLTTAVGLDEPLQDRASEYVEDLSPWTNTSKAVYNKQDNVVVKHAISYKSTGRVVVRDAQTSYWDIETDGEKVRSSFESVDRLDVREGGESFDELDDVTYGRLEDLGYI